MSAAKPLCPVCDWYEQGDACAHHACPGRAFKPANPRKRTDRPEVARAA